jgi:nickel/cobalt transporter (NicO) family protein
VLTAAISFHRIGYGLSLIAAFSLGLAAALTGVGLVALRVRSVVSRRIKASWAGILPLASAGVIAAFGVVFTFRAFGQLV